MELELGIKITHTRDNTTSTTDFRIAKNPSGVLFWSKETDSMFILIIHLKGFRKETIDVEINKDGNRIVISGKKPVQEMVLIKWIMWKKEVELRAFRKVFRIPSVVNLDRIKAKFNEEESTLKITMPKKVKGISGLKIEEENNEEQIQDMKELERTATKIGEIQPTSEDMRIEKIEEENLTLEENVDDTKIDETSREEISERIIGTTKESNPKEQIEELSVEFPETEEEVIAEYEEQQIEEETEQEVVERIEMQSEPSQVLVADIEETGPKPSFSTVQDNDIIEEVETPAMIITPEAIQTLEPKPPDIEETGPKPSFSTVQDNDIVEEVETPAMIITPEAIQTLEPKPPSIEEGEREEPTATNKTPETEEVKEAEKTITNDKPEQGNQHTEFSEPKTTQVEDEISEEMENEKDKSDAQELDEKAKKEEIRQQVDEIEAAAQEIKDIIEEFKQEDKQINPDESKDATRKSKKPRLCAPFVLAGSAFLVSLIVIVIHLIRYKKSKN